MPLINFDTMWKPFSKWRTWKQPYDSLPNNNLITKSIAAVIYFGTCSELFSYELLPKECEEV